MLSRLSGFFSALCCCPRDIGHQREENSTYVADTTSDSPVINQDIPTIDTSSNTADHKQLSNGHPNSMIVEASKNLNVDPGILNSMETLPSELTIEYTLPSDTSELSLSTHSDSCRDNCFKFSTP